MSDQLLKYRNEKDLKLRLAKPKKEKIHFNLDSHYSQFEENSTYRFKLQEEHLNIYGIELIQVKLPIIDLITDYSDIYFQVEEFKNYCYKSPKIQYQFNLQRIENLYEPANFTTMKPLKKKYKLLRILNTINDLTINFYDSDYKKILIPPSVIFGSVIAGSNPATIITCNPHNLTTGDTVSLSNGPFCGDYQVTVIDDFNFTVSYDATTLQKNTNIKITIPKYRVLIRFVIKKFPQF